MYTALICYGLLIQYKCITIRLSYDKLCERVSVLHFNMFVVKNKLEMVIHLHFQTPANHSRTSPVFLSRHPESRRIPRFRAAPELSEG